MNNWFKIKNVKAVFMKKLILPIYITLSFITACDSPRSQRALYNTNNSGLKSNSINPINLDNGSSTTTNNTTVTTNATTPSIPSDATQCKFSIDGTSGFESTSSHLGDYTLCQSSTDKNVVYFQLKTPPINTSGDVSICFIPTTNNGQNSIYVGNPMCGYFKNSKELRKINFIKYAQYSNANITGVIFFKDLSWLYPIYNKYTYGYGYYPVYNNYFNTLDAYKLCMNMLADINNSSNCTYFKNVGQYVYKQF